MKDLACANKNCTIHIEDVIASADHMLSQQNDHASGLRLTFSKYLSTTPWEPPIF
jgi:hypothetical protein